MTTRRRFLELLGFAPAAPLIPKAVLGSLDPDCYVEVDGVPVRGTKPLPLAEEASPSFSFSADPDTGIYRSSSDGIGFAVGGVKRG